MARFPFVNCRLFALSRLKKATIVSTHSPVLSATSPPAFPGFRVPALANAGLSWTTRIRSAYIWSAVYPSGLCLDSPGPTSRGNNNRLTRQPGCLSLVLPRPSRNGGFMQHRSCVRHLRTGTSVPTLVLVGALRSRSSRKVHGNAWKWDADRIYQYIGEQIATNGDIVTIGCLSPFSGRVRQL